MARTVQGGRQVTPNVAPLDNFLASTPLELFSPPDGELPDIHHSKIPPTFGKTVENLMIRDGFYVARKSTDVIGGSATNGTLVYATEFVLSDGSAYIVRFLTTKVQIWSGTTWVDVTGLPTLTGTIENLISIVGWNDLMIFSNGKDGTYTINLVTGVGTTITAAPPAKFLMVFADRLIAIGTDAAPNQIKWSIRKDYSDWTGPGSGFEDMFSTPGGRIDSLTCAHPVGSGVAWIVRTKSLWSMAETGNFDAPFQFNRLPYIGVGSRSKQGVVAIPGGLIIPGEDNIYEVTEGGGVEKIGTGIKITMLKPQTTDFTRLFGVYDSTWDEYRLLVNYRVGSSGPVWRYNRSLKRWTHDVYNHKTITISLGRFVPQPGLSINNLPGAINQLTGTINNLGVDVREGGLIMAVTDASNDFVFSESIVVTGLANGNDVIPDGTGGTTRFPMAAQIESGLVHVDDSRHKVMVVGCELWIEENPLGAPFFVTIEHRQHLLDTWQTYGSFTLTDTASGPVLRRIQKTLESSHSIFRIRLQQLLSGTAFRGLVVDLAKGALINP